MLIYQKGESPQTAAYVWGESIEEILSDATSRLTMHRPAKVLFNERGKRVTSFDAIERDSLLCVTAGDSLKDRRKCVVNFEILRSKDDIYAVHGSS